MKRTIGVLFLAMASLPQFPAELRACRCLPPSPPLEELQTVDEVFRGTVMTFEDHDATSRRAVLVVDAIWKGPFRSVVQVITGLGGADCGFSFVPGEKYIVYALGAEELNTHTCTRTRPDDPEEAAALGEPIWEAPQESGFRRSDPDEDGQSTISDAIRVLNFLFLGDVPPRCLDSADANDDGGLDIADAIHHLSHLFFSTAAPPPPFPDCGKDPTADGLTCERYSAACE